MNTEQLVEYVAKLCDQMHVQVEESHRVVLGGDPASNHATRSLVLRHSGSEYAFDSLHDVAQALAFCQRFIAVETVKTVVVPQVVAETSTATTPPSAEVLHAQYGVDDDQESVHSGEAEPEQHTAFDIGAAAQKINSGQHATGDGTSLRVQRRPRFDGQIGGSQPPKEQSSHVNIDPPPAAPPAEPPPTSRFEERQRSIADATRSTPKRTADMKRVQTARGGTLV